MKFRPDSDEEVCGKRVPGPMSDKYADYGGLACMRTSGHDGECIAMVRDAATADGLRFCCRVPLGSDHRDDCHRGKPCDPPGEACRICKAMMGICKMDD